MRSQDYQVLLYCPNRTGHHPNFARLTAEAFVRTGVSLQIATPPSVTRLLQADLLGVRESPVTILSLPERSPTHQLAQFDAQLNDLRELTQVRRFDRIVIPSGDGLLQILGLANTAGVRIIPPTVALEALVLRGGFAYPSSSVLRHLKHRASWRLVERAPVSVRHHLDPVVIDWLEQQDRNTACWQLMPDPVEVVGVRVDKKSARDALQLPHDAMLIGCVGELNRRKGIHLLLDAFRRARLPSHVHLFLAGTCTPEIRTISQSLSLLPTHHGRVHVLDRWLTDLEVGMALPAMDLVVVPYPGHIGSASIALRAMAAKRPILGSKAPWIARHIREHAAGWVCDVEDPEAFESALVETIVKLTTWQPNPSVDELLRFNSPENFMKHWVRKTVEEIGCGDPWGDGSLS